MAFSMRLNEQDEKLIRTYAEMHGMSVSDFARNAMLEKIEDEYDIKAWQQAKAEYDANPVSYTMDEVEEMLGLKP